MNQAGLPAGSWLVCTQPRRLAATSVASRVAEEMGVRLGEEVGYSIRFENCTHPEITRVKYLTDGALFREAMLDPLLTRYSVIMVDEAHERTIYTDLVLGLLKKILKRRTDLKVIIASATLDAEDFYRYFNDNKTGDPEKDNCSLISVKGRSFPVDIFYLSEPCGNYTYKAVETILDIHHSDSRPGDILVFMTGREEIEDVLEGLRNQRDRLVAKGVKLLAFPLVAGLSMDDQRKVFDRTPGRSRKVIVSTNIAEASVTIDGIAYIIDCGFVKLRIFNPKTGFESLSVVPISKSAAVQRAGRAGRIRPGKAYRLYCEADYETLTDHTSPEMQRCNAAGVILQLKAFGVENIFKFNLMTPPPKQNIIFALELLYSLGALDDYARLTEPLGLHLAEIPVEPQMAAMLIKSVEFKCTAEILSIAAMLLVENVFVTNSRVAENRRRFAVEEGDHISHLNVYCLFHKNQQSQKWCQKNGINHKSMLRATSIRAQLEKYLRRYGMKTDLSSGRSVESVCRCIASAYFSQAAHAREVGIGVGAEESGTYETLRGNIKGLCIHPSSIFFKTRVPEWIIYHEVVETAKIFMRDVLIIKPEWLLELAPHYYESKGVKKKLY